MKKTVDYKKLIKQFLIIFVAVNDRILGNYEGFYGIMERLQRH